MYKRQAFTRDLVGFGKCDSAHYDALLTGCVAIARALVLEPPLVLADEPTGNLDRASSDEVFALMRRMHAELNTSFLIVTHDPRLAERCDRIIELVDGRVESDERPVKTPA